MSTMYLQRLSKWFLTEPGKRFVYIAAGTSAVGLVALKTVPNTLLVDKYRSLMQLYKNGMAEHLSKEIKDRFKKALDIAGVPEEEHFLFHPFHVIGYDMFHAGSAYSRFGALIGIPHNFTFKDVESIDRSDILVNSESVAWGTPEANSLMHSLVLSDKAQLYAMVRDIKLSQSHKFVLESLYTMFPIIFYYGTTNFINTKYNLYVKPLPVRFIMYSLVGCFTWGYYYFLKDFTQMYFENKIDKEIKEQHPDLAKGAKEFYDKIMKRNVALRALMGKVGESTFTALGNDNYLIRQKHVPFSERKLFFETDQSSA